ncbi:MAG: hypothetical protein V4437_00745 [Patescibacteria group bacterium]
MALHNGVRRGIARSWLVLLITAVFFGYGWFYAHPEALGTMFGGSASVAASDQTVTNWKTFNSKKLGISILYPQEYSVDDSYVYTELGPRNGIGGVKFTVPASKTEGTNLSHSDTGVSIEVLPSSVSCLDTAFVEAKLASSSVTENGTTYSIASTAGAGAGNFYEETVYVIAGSVPCTAIRYFIHSTNIHNYEPGTIREFDKKALIKEFDKIRRSLLIIR